MFERFAISKLKEWAERKNRKPLVLRGARQVGKTTLVDIFSKVFNQYIYLNLEIAEDRTLFERDYNIHELVDAIFLYKGKSGKIPETLIFIDEIQNAPQAVSSLRYFYEEEKSFYVIAAGSLLETLIHRQISFPVGRVEYMPLYPLSFVEFLNALDEGSSIDILNIIPIPDYAHEKLLSLFRLYTLVGGMPEIIQNFIDNRDIVALAPLYDALIISYKDDVEKYARSLVHTRILRHTVEHAFREAGSRITYQGFGNSNYKTREMSEAFRTLEKALFLRLMFPVTSTKIPLTPDIRRSPKLNILDTGLVNYAAGIQKEVFGSQTLTDVYEGRIAEHIVGQELTVLLNSLVHNIYFWTREKTDASAEIDFVYQFGNKVIPIEVKSGKTGKLRSIHEFIDRADHPYAVRIYSGKLCVVKARTRNGKNFNLLNLPFYLINKLEEYLKWLIEDQE